MALGIVGEYIGRIYDEVKRRPPYVVKRVLDGVMPEAAATSARCAPPTVETPREHAIHGRDDRD